MADNPFLQYVAPGGSSASGEQGGNPFLSYVSGTSNPSPTAAGSPNNGQAPSPSQSSDNDSWMKKAWNWANTPLTTSLFGLPEERAGAGGFERGVEHIVAGLTSPLSVALTAATFGTGGFIESAGTTALKESGEFTAEEIAQIAKGSKIALDTMKAQTPIEPVISDALKAAHTPEELDLLKLAKAKVDPALLNPEFQFGKDSYQGLPGKPGILEKVGLSPKQVDDFAEEKLSPAEREAIAVKNGGFSDKEISTLGNIGETVRKAETEFNPITEAVKNAGIDPSLLKRGEKVLYDNGLNQTDLLGRDLMERGAFQIIRNTVPTLPIASAARAARTAHVLMTGGFTLQQLEMASQMSPRFLDALKEGDYDHAWEYGTEAFAGATMGILGAPHFLHSAGELFHPLIEEGGFRPSDNWVAADRINKQREVVHAAAEQHAINVFKTAMDKAGLPTEPGPLGWSKEQKDEIQAVKDRIFINHQTQGDPETAAALRQALDQAEAVGGGEHRPLSGPPVGTPLVPEEAPARTNTQVIHSNEAGEVRVGEDGRPVVWVDPQAWADFSKAGSNEGLHGITGLSLSSFETEKMLSRLNPEHPLHQLLDAAQKASPQGLMTAAKTGTGIKVVLEELHHTWARELSRDGDIVGHLNPEQWTGLRDIIPERWTADHDQLGYEKDPITRVAEASAQMMSGIRLGYAGEDQEIVNFLSRYFDEVTKKHGPRALDALQDLRKTAEQHIEDIYAARESANRASDREAGPGKLPGVREGSRSSDSLGEEKPGGVRGKTPEGVRREPTPEESVRLQNGEIGPKEVDSTRNPLTGLFAKERAQNPSDEEFYPVPLSKPGPILTGERGSNEYERTLASHKYEWTELKVPSEWSVSKMGGKRDPYYSIENDGVYQGRWETEEEAKRELWKRKAQHVYEKVEDNPLVGQELNIARQVRSVFGKNVLDRLYDSVSDKTIGVNTPTDEVSYERKNLASKRLITEAKNLLETGGKSGILPPKPQYFFHGTYDSSLPEILEKGLLTKHTGESTGGIAHREDEYQGKGKYRGTVFVGDHLTSIAPYTYGAALRLKIPYSIYSKFELDPVGDQMYHGDIPAKYIVEYYTKDSSGKWTRHKIGSEGLQAKELDKEPVGFVSPNVHNLNLADVALRLNSRPQKLTEKLSNDFAQALPGVRAQVRPAIGHWEGGAENTTVHRFAPGTDPDAVEYHNAFISKAGYQNMGMGFIPGEGNDVLFQFRVPGRFTPNEIAGVLEAHGIPGDTIEPIPGGNIVHIVSDGGKLQPQVSEIASRLDAGKVEQTYGRKFEHGSYDSRDTAQAVLESKLSEIEERHPEWRAIRNSFESRPDHVELQRLTRETKQPFIEATHGTRTPGLETLSPEMFGKGPQKGAEQARAKAYPEDFPKRTYFQVNDTHGEPFYTHQAYQYKARFNSENLYDLARDPDGLLSKAQQEAAARKMLGPDALWTIYERMIKDSGYEGGYKPDGTLMAFKDTPVESILKKEGVAGLMAKERGPEEWDDVKQHLTPEELKKHDTPEKQRMLTAAFNAMPNADEWTAAVRAGASGRLWYERSSRAFDALLDSGADWIKPKDKPKFLNLVAALSPVQPVKANLLMALNLWAKWDKAGRPTDVTWDGKQVANKNASLYRILKGRGQTQGVDLPARMNNSIRALQGEPLSGPKVSAFTTNLGRDVNRVTNDTWMAVFGDQDPNTINKPHLYDALSAHIREAGKAEGIPPRQAQAAVWSFIKSLAELSGWGNDRWIPPQEIIKQGLLTPDLVSAHASDFADLLSHDSEIRGRIQSLGGDLNALDAKLKARVPERPAAGEAQAAAPELLGPAGRLEAARSNARTQAHLARKSGPSLFDSEFRPDTGLFAKDRPNNGLPENIQQLIDTNVFKDMPKEYRDRIFSALDDTIAGRLSDKVKDATKYIRDEDSQNYELGAAYDLIQHYIENHLTRMYQDENPAGRVINSEAKAGRFSTNVSMARHQVYDSFATALLKSPKQIVFDPAMIVSKGRADIIKAAANKQFIAKMRDDFVRGSDGLPAVVLSGSGKVVSGPNGEDPKTMVYPGRVSKINVADSVIDHLKKTGDFDRFIEQGSLKDITPKVRPDNIGAAIDRLTHEAETAHGGTGENVKYDEEGNNVLRQQIKMLEDVRDGKRPWSDIQGPDGYNSQIKPVYAWDPQGYITLDKSAVRGWNFVTNDPSGHQVLVDADVRVHPEFAEYFKNRLGLEPSQLQKNPVSRALLGAGTKLKQTLLSLSPFHMVQIALRGVMTGVNPFTLHGPDIIDGAKVDPADPQSPTILHKAVEQGATLGADYKALQEHSEGLAAGGGLMRMIPGVGGKLSSALDWYQDFLFKRYIPAIKATAIEHMFREYQNMHPEWSVDKVAKAAAMHANDSFGGINWQAMGRSATTQDWGRLLLLAPDWLESEMRSGIRLFNKEEGGLGRKQVAMMAMGLWGVARVLNYLTTGQPHLEAPFGLAVQNKEGKETIFGIRTLPTDLLHAATDPVGFVKGRFSPTVRLGTETVTGRDQFGRKMAPGDLWVDILHQVAPIPLQSLGQAVSGTGPEIGNVGQAAKAMGGTAQTYQTPAQKMAADLAASHTEDGPIDPAGMARHRQVLRIEDQVRAGEMSYPDLMKMTYQTDQIKESELKKITDNLKKTQGMPAPMASLYSRASRLPAKEYLQLLDVSNPAERAALVPLTIQVQKRYLNKAKKDETPDERQRDPVFQRFLNMIPGVRTQSQAAPSPVIPPAVQQEMAHLESGIKQQTA